ncbi:hypothetical protein J1605_021335 [Eschrichtius robustus]|uniref:Uncharacterized protein n=1 Tax=Eschrichtius robustus TaxID=9764 RepID=A0AB34HGC3_ESCRO|nr:hypothetical protein J1605_021335 [Eschrichtius robustus]
MEPTTAPQPDMAPELTPEEEQHVGSSRTRARTSVPCISRRILNHYATREVPVTAFEYGLQCLSPCVV